MTNKKHWINRLVPALAFTAGIIIASTGGVITTSSALKLALFDSHKHDISAARQCDHNIILKKNNTENQDLDTEEHKDLCIATETLRIKKSFQNDKKEDIIEGVSLLIVGGILLLVFRKRN